MAAKKAMSKFLETRYFGLVIGFLVFLIMLGYKVRAATQREWILYLAGGLSVLFGILVVANPLAGSLSVIKLIAAWALVTGVLKIIFAFRVKNLPERVGDRIAGLR